MLEVWLLGKFEVRLDDVAVQLPSRSEQSLLAYLMLNAGTAYRREKLVGLFWPEADESHAKGYLRLALWHIRRALKGASAHSPDFFVTDKITIAFNGELEYWLDVAVLERESGRSIQALLESTSVYQGELLPGFYDEWATLERESLRALYERKMSALVERLLSERRWQEAIEQAERWISLGDTPEPAYRGLMIACAGLGEVPAAVAAYQRCVEALKRDLDVEPSAESRALYEKIRSGQEILQPITSQSIRGFELRAKIGEGNYGAVYCAFQKSVGREVAVKVIRPHFANDPEFIRRFEVEAQTVARLEHPNIVPLYDYWREPDGAYLVMRLLRGGNLSSMLESGPLATGRAIELVEQIAAGLATAHQQGVVHGDLKPANILLDESGIAYLSDFGIAGILEGDGHWIRAVKFFRTSAYGSPEQFQNQPLTPQSDIYGFGIVLYQMLTGKLPFPDTDQLALIEKRFTQPFPSVGDCRPDLPDEVDKVIQCATAVDSRSRFTDTLALAAAFRHALSASTEVAAMGVAPVLEVVNPYKGLRPFQEADAADFFGREELTQRLVARLGESDPVARFMAVVGASGSGKSSLVKAGLIPALRRGVLPGSENWFVVKMVPGGHPFEELEIGLLRIATNPSIRLMEPLRRDERGILRAARLALPCDESELLLVVDQFEEVFTLAEDEDEARQFIESLFVAVTEPRSPVRVVITLRADFFDRPLMNKDLSKLLQDRTEVVVPLSIPELERAIRSPAQRVGVEVEPDLVTAIVANVMEQPGALPLLQYALTELFERREDHRLTLEGYQTLGGVGGILDQRAEQVFAGLSEAGKTAVWQIFLRLVTLGEDAGADGLPAPDTRRRVLRTELEGVAIGSKGFSSGLATQTGGDSTTIGKAIDAFGSARLLSFDRDAATRSPTVEIAHEALLSEWQRLRGWLEEGRGDVRMQRSLGYAASEWSEAGRDSSFLLRGARLSHYEDWATGTDLALTGEERLFLDASLAERQARRDVEEARQQREAARERRVRNVLRSLVVIFFIVALGSLALARNARQQANLTVSHELAGLAIDNLETDPERSILLSLYALRTAYTRQAEDALRQAMRSSRVSMALTGHSGGARSVEFSPDGKTIATTSSAGQVTVWDAGNGRQLFSLPGTIARYSPDGARLATGSPDGTVTLWDTDTRDELLTMGGHHRRVYDVHFSPDGRLLVSDFEDNTFTVWDIQTGQEVFSSDPTDSVLDTLYYVAFSPDGRLLISLVVTGSGNEISFWGADRDWALLAQGKSDDLMLLSPDGERLVAWGGGKTPANGFVLRDLSTTSLESVDFSALSSFSVPVAHETFIIDCAFSRDGSMLASVDQDGLAKVWRLTSEMPVLLMVLSGHAGGLTDVAFSPDGNQLATASNDGSVRIWDITPEGPAEWFKLIAHNDEIGYSDITADGKYLVTASRDGSAKVWDMASLQLLVAISEHGGRLAHASISSDSSLLATGGEDNIAKIWKLHLSPGAPTYELLHTLRGHSAGALIAMMYGGITSCKFSPDGARLATSGVDGLAKIWDVRTGQELLSIQAHPDRLGLTYLVFSPDGRLLATSSAANSDGYNAQVKIWDAESGEEISTISFPGRTGNIWGLAFSPDGKRIATGSEFGILKIWEAKTGKELEDFAGYASVSHAEFSPDGKLLATTSFDGTARIWDVTSGQILQVYTYHISLYSVAFTPDGKKVIVSGDGLLYGNIIDTQEVMRVADSRLTRWFTLNECRQYLHREQCPER